MAQSAAARVEPGELLICAGCRRLKGVVPGGGPRVQRCKCQAEVPERGARTWKGYDHNTYAELCRCCGLVLLPSGSRWSVWFCAECKPLVVAFNRALGRYVVPIGRHSIMNRVGGRTEDLVSTEAIEQYAERVRSMVAGIDALAAFARRVVEHNLAALGFDAGQDVPLKAYLGEVERSTLTHHDAFVALALNTIGRGARPPASSAATNG